MGVLPQHPKRRLAELHRAQGMPYSQLSPKEQLPGAAQNGDVGQADKRRLAELQAAMQCRQMECSE